ncbi:MAG TPA: kelch repeat-containing protein [Bryobacteraceae bacterium]|nr:kelch repeat-containing protein [Bryobacteraceae bacterium]
MILFALCAVTAALAGELPPNRWVKLQQDAAGARPGSAVRYASGSGKFLLWGFQNADRDLPQEQPLMVAPEYDMVAFDLDGRRWINHLPPSMEKAWNRRLPLTYVPRTYSGITTGSERTTMRGVSNDQGAVSRPDLNIVFEQVAYRPKNDSLYYFAGGLTAAYDARARRWTDLQPAHSPPPVAGGSLAYDPIGDQLILFGGGHVAERQSDGSIRGHTGTWAYRFREKDWRQLPMKVQPPPRMGTRMVYDSRRQALVLFGGDAQKHYLADTWTLDLKQLEWQQSRAPGGPEARAGHFTVYDAESGQTIVGGGYQRQDLSDMWAYDATADRWSRFQGNVPTGFHLSADLAAHTRVILLVTSTRAQADRSTCNMLFPVRTTFAYRIAKEGPAPMSGAVVAQQQPVPKRAPFDAAVPSAAVPDIPFNEWVLLGDASKGAPSRTWGSATFDSKRQQILYWGGGHCGYEGSDVDAYDVATNTWIPEPGSPSYPERLWNHGVRLAGVTFDGEPFTDHGRRIYAYDPVGDRMIMARPIRLTSGYDPAPLRSYPSKKTTAPDAVVTQPSSYVKYATWSYNLRQRRWTILGPAPAGLDTLVTTPLGVMGVNVNWPGRLNDAGYQLPWNPALPEDNAIYLLRDSKWDRLSAPGPSPQNLYELTSLAFDTKRSQVILHGAGPNRNELWTFDLKTRRWQNRFPRVITGEEPPACTREAVYLPDPDAMLIQGPGMWQYLPGNNTWKKLPVSEPQRAGQNRAMVFDASRNLILLVLGSGGNDGKASVYGMRYRR